MPLSKALNLPGCKGLISGVFACNWQNKDSPSSLRRLYKKHLLVALQLACRGDGEEAVCSGVVDQRARQQETGEEPAEGVAVLLEEHQHPFHRLDTERVVTWQRERQEGQWRWFSTRCWCLAPTEEYTFFNQKAWDLHSASHSWYFRDSKIYISPAGVCKVCFFCRKGNLIWSNCSAITKNVLCFFGGLHILF